MHNVTNKDLKAPGVIEISPGKLSIVKDINREKKLEFSLPVHFEIAAVIVCKKGEAKAVLNDIPITIHEEDFLVITPDSILEKFEDISGDCDISIIMISGAERFRAILIDRQLWDLMIRVRKDPVIHLSKKDKSLGLISKELMIQVFNSQSKGAYTEQLLSAIADVFLFEILNMLSDKFAYQPRREEKISGQRVFLRFIDTLKDSYGQLRSVDEMARTLCVSPKYLARVVKDNSGMTPSQWMDEYTMRAIIHELRHTDKPMKDIALSMGFPNPSSFGTYFRKHEGISPAAYRKKFN